MTKKLRIAAVTAGIAAAPFFALAQYIPYQSQSQSGTGAGPTSVGQLITLINQIVTWFTTIVFAIAIIMILVAAFQFLTAAGNEEKVSTARKSLLWGLVGIAVALFAQVAQTFVTNLLNRQ